jgi:hypothetical protein
MELSAAADGRPMAPRTSEGAARVLRESILSGLLKPGEPLRERILADELVGEHLTWSSRLALDHFEAGPPEG